MENVIWWWDQSIKFSFIYPSYLSATCCSNTIKQMWNGFRMYVLLFTDKSIYTAYYCSVDIVRKYWAGNTSYFLLSETVSVQPNVQIFALDNSSFPWGIHISSVVFQHAKSSKTQVPGLFLQQPVCVSVGAKCREEAQLSLLVQSITLEGQCTIS